jgi:hypothetical protein
MVPIPFQIFWEYSQSRALYSILIFRTDFSSVRSIATYPAVSAWACLIQKSSFSAWCDSLIIDGANTISNFLGIQPKPAHCIPS